MLEAHGTAVDQSLKQNTITACGRTEYAPEETFDDSAFNNNAYIDDSPHNPKILKVKYFNETEHENRS